MIFFNDKISVRQLQILLILDIFGTGVIVLPRRVALFANQDGFIVIILSTLVAIAYALLITSVAKLFPNDDFVTYSSKILSRPVGVILSLGFVAKIIINAAMELRFFGEIVKQTLLFNTPFWIVCMLMVLVSGYAASKGYEARARIGEIIILLVLVPLLFVFIVACFDLNLSNIMPVMITPPSDLIKGAFFCGISFTGLEFCFLVFPFINTPDKVRKGVVSVIALIGIFMLFITVVTLAKFGALDVKEQLWPVLEVMDVTRLSGSFASRQEAFIMSFFIISVFAIVNAGLFFSSLLLKSVFGIGSHSKHIFACSIIIFVVSLMPRNIADVYDIMNFMFITFGLCYFLIVPMLMLIVAKIRNLGGKHNA